MDENPVNGGFGFGLDYGSSTPYPVILVLAHHLEADESPNLESKARADAAVAAWARHEADVVKTTGWQCGDLYSRPIAHAMADYVRSVGVEIVAIDVRARDTVGDAVFTKGLVPPLVVTSNYHVERTREIFSFVYGEPVDVIGADVPFNDETLAAEKRSLAAFRQTFEGITPGDYPAIMARMLERHPFYNGTIYPAMSPE